MDLPIHNDNSVRAENVYSKRCPRNRSEGALGYTDIKGIQKPCVFDGNKKVSQEVQHNLHVLQSNIDRVQRIAPTCSSSFGNDTGLTR
jgi:hypothetical protein